MNEKLKSADIDLLIDGMTHLRTHAEYYNFFEDILTIAELKSLSVRFKAAKLLYEGHTYNEVAAITGASSTTISRISRALSYGANGYNCVLRRMEGRSK